MYLNGVDFELTYIFDYFWNFIGTVVNTMKSWTITLHGHTVSFFSLALAVFVITVVTSALPVIGGADKEKDIQDERRKHK